MSPRMRKFAEEYIHCGNATEAAIRAGYAQKHANKQGSACLANPKVQELLQRMSAAARLETIATALERQEFWTRIMRNDIDASLSERMRASELLGKVQGDFLEKREEAITLTIRREIIHVAKD